MIHPTPTSHPATGCTAHWTHRWPKSRCSDGNLMAALCNEMSCRTHRFPGSRIATRPLFRPSRVLGSPVDHPATKCSRMSGGSPPGNVVLRTIRAPAMVGSLSDTLFDPIADLGVDVAPVVEGALQNRLADAGLEGDQRRCPPCVSARHRSSRRGPVCRPGPSRRPQRAVCRRCVPCRRRCANPRAHRIVQQDRPVGGADGQ